MNKLEMLRAELNECAVRVNTLAAIESRSDDQNAELDEAIANCDRLQAEVAREEGIRNLNAKLAAPQARVIRPATPAAKPAHGELKAGEFYNLVAAAATGRVDPRLVQNAAGDYVQEGVNADGGFALVPDARGTILKAITAPESILGRLDLIYTSSNTVTLPVDENPVWSTDGIAPGTIGEAGQYTASTPALKQLSMTLAKKGALVYVTEEMISDVANIGQYVTDKSAEKIKWAVDADIFAAIKGSGSKLAVDKAAGAAAGSAPTLANIEAMHTALLTQNRAGAVWLANPNLESVFRSFTIGNVPVYLPAGGLSAAPFATLLGHPVIFTELCSAVGTEGDVVLVDPSSIFGVLKSTGVNQEISAHVKFDYDLVAFKSNIRFVAKSKLSAKVTRPDGSEASNIVVVATRA